MKHELLIALGLLEQFDLMSLKYWFCENSSKSSLTIDNWVLFRINY